MRTLQLDIETAPNLAYVWSLWGDNVPLQMLVDSGYVLCWTAKWLGDSEILFDSLYHSNKKHMLRGIHKLLDEADVVVHYNGKRFDIPVLNGEFVRAGMLPPSPYKQIDLLETVKANFRLPSYKLEYVATMLGIGHKIGTDFALWVGCMQNDPKSWELMRDYNINDVYPLLEEVYMTLRPWIKNHPNIAVYDDTPSVCPVCGSDEHHKRGWSYTKTGKYHRYQCKNCGKYYRDAKSVGLPPQYRYTDA